VRVAPPPSNKNKNKEENKEKRIPPPPLPFPLPFLPFLPLCTSAAKGGDGGGGAWTKLPVRAFRRQRGEIGGREESDTNSKTDNKIKANNKIKDSKSKTKMTKAKMSKRKRSGCALKRSMDAVSQDFGKASRAAEETKQVAVEARGIEKNADDEHDYNYADGYDGHGDDDYNDEPGICEVDRAGAGDGNPHNIMVEEEDDYEDDDDDDDDDDYDYDSSSSSSSSPTASTSSSASPKEGINKGATRPSPLSSSSKRTSGENRVGATFRRLVWVPHNCGLPYRSGRQLRRCLKNGGGNNRSRSRRWKSSGGRDDGGGGGSRSSGGGDSGESSDGGGVGIRTVLFSGDSVMAKHAVVATDVLSQGTAAMRVSF
jgi:hypothetical protein